ncbi:hypothetical protein ACQUQU_03485 [Thalassolituus sp. LLYu03]|uniref:hypothetical protein n=1 Tax=Thalassolituus sp. LLYu03 TaxID=3421656 RepID=UPI003D2E8309
MKDYLFIFLIAVLGGALAWQVFFPPQSADDDAVAAAREAERVCLAEKSQLAGQIMELNARLSQLVAARDAADLRAAQAEGKVSGLSATIEQRNRELTEHQQAFARLKTSRDELMAVNQDITRRLSLLQRLSEEGSARSADDLARLREQGSGLLVLEGTL